MRNTKNYYNLPYNPNLRDRARELRKAGILSEVLIWEQLRNGKFKGLDFDRQKIIGNYIVDFFCAECRVVIEIDGNSHNYKVEYDYERDIFLDGLGLIVIHILAGDVLNRLDGVMMMLQNHPSLRAPLNHPGATRHPSKEGNILQKEHHMKYYITTPIYFPSGQPHIGHSYTTVAADTMARYKRMRGYDVYFLTGSDEHGQKIERNAAANNVTPQEYVDEIVAMFQNVWRALDITNDDFIRTTQPRHIAAVQKIFKKLYDKGDIYKSEYEGWYCTPCESFWTKLQLQNGKCPDCGREVELTREESYFFRLSKYTEQLTELIENNPDFIVPQSRRNEMLNNFLKVGLEDLCVSRTSFKWGVPVDFDDGHIVYVWVDALSNYITALGYMSEDDEKFKKYWPADVHLMAKEIVRFHTIIWPAILLSLELPLPKQIFGHGWLLFDGGKMSKSVGNVIDPIILVEKYGVDAIRYFLMRDVPFGADGHFSNDALIGRINSDLANDLGNLVSRSVAMIDKYFGGTLPNERTEGEFDNELITLARETAPAAEELIEKFQFSAALTAIWRLVSRTNKYIDETAPWTLAKDPAAAPRLASVLYNLAESIRVTAVLISPFMPSTAKEIFKQLGAEDEALTSWDSAKTWGTLSKFTVQKGAPLFPRIEQEK